MPSTTRASCRCSTRKPGAKSTRRFLSCYEAKTGKPVYEKQRIAPSATAFTASPWAYGGKVFCLSEEGDTFVINPGDAYDEVAKNSLGEMTLATPAVTRDGLFVRTATALYRIR